MAGIYIPSLYSGPGFAAGQPRQIVIHSIESEIIPGLAVSLAQGWFQNPDNETSAHTLADPAAEVQSVDYAVQAWHCGGGNPTSLGKEHAGRASMTREEWTTPAGLQMLRNSAAEAAVMCRRFNIRPRWLSLEQLARNEDGFCTHLDMSQVRGGSTHTDPGRGFPYDIYIGFVIAALGGTLEEDDLNDTQDTWLAQTRYNSVAVIAPNVLTTNSAVADIQRRVDAMEDNAAAAARDAAAALVLVKKLAEKEGVA